MTYIEKLGLTIDTSSVAEATAALNALAAAAERVSKALNDLGSKAHGNITINVAGSLAKVDIQPMDRIVTHGAPAFRSA